MSDLFGNYIVGFPTRRLCVSWTNLSEMDSVCLQVLSAEKFCKIFGPRAVGPDLCLEN